jgi:hypothetical protein
MTYDDWKTTPPPYYDLAEYCEVCHNSPDRCHCHEDEEEEPPCETE